ncbi:sensor histidine kinase [Montanilutibacter psychrotolerans]|uniref:histidine kinase n=1 Tax=Montanilutibacter psychrotolerans TaxID=1327343 RepID=A0A3M8SS78_9GAMM|nr:HAMP domain-containing sensor histidine kinase [Lysobacter psychrotolerans]RNF84188.1 sensor histidine kinase [Lysobacter psychrotolerans]
MAHGLPRRIKIAFVSQALIGSVLISLCILLAGLLVHRYVVADGMRTEAAAFWAGYRDDPAYPLPHTSTMRGYLQRPGTDHLADLPGFDGLGPGIHAVVGADRYVYIEDTAQGRLYLTYATGLVARAIVYTGLVSLLLSLLATYLISWLTYRNSKPLVVPVSWLANVVKQWDPRDPDVNAINAANLPPGASEEVHRLARALIGLADRVGDFVQRERDFTRDASHELRTPLTVIRVATDLLIDDPETSPKSLRSLARLQRAGRDMEAVIDAFLILAREADVEPMREEFEVRDVVREEVERIRPQLHDKPVSIEVIDNGGPHLFAPPHVLNVMLGNLLGNAATFTEHGTIEVRLYHDRIEVQDSGIGMGAEDLARAFDPFFRAEVGRGNGNGMGLSIVRRLGERFGWPVSLTSAPGEGTVATISFRG